MDATTDTQTAVEKLVDREQNARQRIAEAATARKLAAQDRALAALELYELIGRAAATIALGLPSANRLDNLVATGRQARTERATKS